MTESYYWSQFAPPQTAAATTDGPDISHSLLWQLFRNCPLGLLVVDNATGNLVAVNREFCRITRYEEDDLIGIPYTRLIAPEDSERVADYHERRKRNDPTLPTSYEMLIQNRYGDRRVVVFHAQILPFSDVIFASIRDITQEKLLVDPLLYTQRIDSIASLAGGMGHEFNNLLAGISGYAQLAASRAEKMPEVVHALQSIQAAVESGTRHVQALLAFARKGTHAIQSVDIASLLEGLLTLLPRLATVEIKTGIDKPQQPFRTRGDGAQLEQAFLSILQNAVESLPPDGGTVAVSIDSARIESMHNLTGGDYARVIIRDSGLGIPVENIPRVFQPFFSTKQQGKHPGLGLSTSYGTVKDHGGAISVDSTPGLGTTVSVFLPLERHPSLLVPARVPRAGGESLETPLILIIDDQEFVGELMKDILETAGYVARYETSGRSALEKLLAGQLKPALVIVDLLMPDIDGRKVIRRITQRDSPPPVVATSGYATPELGDSQLSQMTRGFLRKPFRNEELLELVARILGPPVVPTADKE